MKSIFNGRVAGVFLVMLFMTLGSGPVIAGPEKNCESDKWKDHPICTGDDPGGDDPVGVMTPTFNTAHWFGPHITEEDPAGGEFEPRACGCGGYPNPQGAAGHVCHQFGPMENLVRVDLTNLSYQPEGKGASDYCDWLYYGDLVFNVWPGDDRDDSISRSYHYGMDPTWNDGPCIDEQSSCLVKVYTQAYFEEGPIGCEGSKCGRLVELEGWGRVDPYGQVDGVYEFNPFRAGPDIYIDELMVTFRGVKRDKRVARCSYTAFPNGRPVFRTIPDLGVSCPIQ